MTTSAVLSDKTESATSFAFQALLSFEVRKRGLGGPICNKDVKSKDQTNELDRHLIDLRDILKQNMTTKILDTDWCKWENRHLCLGEE